MFFSQIRLTLKKGSVKWVILAKNKPYFLKNQIKLAIKIVYFHVKKMNKEMNKSLCEIEEIPIVQQKRRTPMSVRHYYPEEEEIFAILP